MGDLRIHSAIRKKKKKYQPSKPETTAENKLKRDFNAVKAPGVDGMTINETFIFLREHNHEIVDRIKAGHYTPSPVRRVEIPKPDGGVQKFGIPIVIDRIIQQAMAQQMIPIYEPLF